MENPGMNHQSRLIFPRKQLVQYVLSPLLDRPLAIAIKVNSQIGQMGQRRGKDFSSFRCGKKVGLRASDYDPRPMMKSY